MASTVAPTKQIIMSDMFTRDNDVRLRQFKVSARPADVDDVIENRKFVLSGEFTVNAGVNLAVNITGRGDYAITEVYVNGAYPVEIRDEHASGGQGGDVLPVNYNLTSNLDGSATGQLFFNAVQTGRLIAQRTQAIEKVVVCNDGSTPCVLATNDTGSAKTIRISVDLVEVGEERVPEVITYNSDAVTYNGEPLFYV